MKRLHLIMPSFWLLLWASSVFAQTVSRADIQDELELSRELLLGLEETAGYMNLSLVELIEQIADRLMVLNEFDEAHAMLDRALQITRINQGLYTEDQLPFLFKKIENYANQRNWDKARQQMEHLLWLYQTKRILLAEDLVDELLQFSSFHLRAITEDAEAWQGYHFRKATQLKWMALAVAERIWGETDPRLAPILYSQITQFHLQKVAVEHGGSTGYTLREILPGSRIARERVTVRNSYYFTGLALLNRLQKIYANAESPDLEGLAMSSLYLADWQALYNRPEEALTNYRLAYQRLIEAEVEPGPINDLFSQPMVLPAAEFYPSVNQALQSRESSRVEAESEVGAGSSGYLSFREWTNAFPNVRNPISVPGVGEDSNFALFSFSLAGVNEVSRWFHGRYTSNVSMVNEAELLEQVNSPAYDQESLLERLNLLRFRPKLIDGEAQEATGLLKYQFAADTLL